MAAPDPRTTAPPRIGFRGYFKIKALSSRIRDRIVDSSLTPLRSQHAHRDLAADQGTEILHPSSSSGTVAHAGPPSFALPSIWTSRRVSVPARARSISRHPMPVRGTFARRVQQESAWPAEVPELT